MGHFFKVVVMTSEMIRPQRYLPPFVLFLFLVHLVFILMQPDRMLMDPGTGWQLKTGQLLVQTGVLPVHDPFSYTVPQQTWTLYQWLFQLLSGLLQEAGGIPLVTVVCALVLGWTLLVLMRRMLEQGTQILCALFMVFVVWLVMTMHLQARPHVVTYLFFCLFLLQLERAYAEAKGGGPLLRSLLPLPFLMIFWCNMHGGFVSGLILCGIFWVGSLLDAATRRDTAGWHRSFAFLACVVVCLLASFCNPYGWGLHRAILSYLDLESLKFWQEYTTPFVHDSLNVRLFEGTVLLLLILLVRARGKLSWPEMGCLIFFLYHAVGSIRHVILFMLVAAPVVARLGSQWGRKTLPALARRLDVITEDQKKSKTGWIYAGLVSMLFLGLVWLTPGLFRRDLDDLRLSKASADYIEKNRDRFRCMFNTDDLGGALIYRFGPDLKVFMDDRTDLYRDDFILGTYLPVLRMEEGWYGKLEALGVDSAVLPRNSLLGQGFRDLGWQLVHEDGWNALYLKRR